MYQVKAVKTFHGHDGHGWECKLYRDGKAVAIVVEDGYGGELKFHWSDQTPDIPRVECRNRNYDGNINTYKGTPEEARLEAHVLDLPQIDSPFEDDGKMYISADVFVDDMVTEALYTKDVKKLLKKLAFVKADGQIYHYKSDNPQTRSALAKSDPDAIILNDMPHIAAPHRHWGWSCPSGRLGTRRTALHAMLQSADPADQRRYNDASHCQSSPRDASRKYRRRVSRQRS